MMSRKGKTRRKENRELHVVNEEEEILMKKMMKRMESKRGVGEKRG